MQIFRYMYTCIQIYRYAHIYTYTYLHMCIYTYTDVSKNQYVPWDHLSKQEGHQQQEPRVAKSLKHLRPGPETRTPDNRNKTPKPSTPDMSTKGIPLGIPAPERLYMTRCPGLKTLNSRVLEPQGLIILVPHSRGLGS